MKNINTKALNIIKKSNKIFGLWKNRNFDTDKYLRDLRRERKINLKK